MEIAISVLALLTGLVTGALFRYLGIPIPAPPNVAGVLGIFGLFLGYQVIEYLDIGIDLVATLGVS